MSLHIFLPDVHGSLCQHHVPSRSTLPARASRCQSAHALPSLSMPGAPFNLAHVSSSLPCAGKLTVGAAVTLSQLLHLLQAHDSGPPPSFPNGLSLFGLLHEHLTHVAHEQVRRLPCVPRWGMATTHTVQSSYRPETHLHRPHDYLSRPTPLPPPNPNRCAMRVAGRAT